MSGLGQPSATGVASPAGREGWKLVLLASLAVLGLLLVVLAVTGVVLTARYRPIAPGGASSSGAPDQTVRDLHRLSAALAQSVVLLAVVAALGWSYRIGRRAWVGPAVLLVLVLSASVSGNLLPYEQVALQAVTVGEPLEGIWFVAFDEGVRFVLVGGTEVSQAQYRMVVLAHFALAAAAVAGLVVVARRPMASSRQPDSG
jgi:quinol-cytochrome oxidoreductase complex cytochrome b subunit